MSVHAASQPFGGTGVIGEVLEVGSSRSVNDRKHTLCKCDLPWLQARRITQRRKSGGWNPPGVNKPDPFKVSKPSYSERGGVSRCG